MKILLTGATGFIGSYLLPELLRNGHEVIGLTRTGKGAKTLEAAGATAIFGELTDLKSLRDATNSVDGVIHTAFNHDFSKLKRTVKLIAGLSKHWVRRWPEASGHWWSLPEQVL